MNAAIRLKDVPRFPVSPQVRTQLYVAADTELRRYAALMTIYGPGQAGERYRASGGIIVFDAHDDPWILVEVT